MQPPVRCHCHMLPRERVQHPACNLRPGKDKKHQYRVTANGMSNFKHVPFEVMAAVVLKIQAFWEDCTVSTHCKILSVLNLLFSTFLIKQQQIIILQSTSSCVCGMFINKSLNMPLNTTENENHMLNTYVLCSYLTLK